MQNWIIIDEDYLNYLRSFESRIPLSDYGANKFKPFFGVLFQTQDLYYVTQISHAQERHLNMKNSIDFYKIFAPTKSPVRSNHLLAVVNLNFMFPVPKFCFENLEYKDIDKHRIFSSEQEKTQYINLLRLELTQINSLDIECKARKLYEIKLKHPEDRISQRCLNFKELEVYASEYKLHTSNLSTI